MRCLMLVAIFCCTIVVVVAKININPAYYLTPDSHYYLQAAQNLLDGKGYMINYQGQTTFCAIWPVGYAATIASISWATGISVAIASKTVNLLAVAGILFFLRKSFSATAPLVALSVLSSSFLQLVSNTWSETLFVFFLVGFCFYLNKTNIYYLLIFAIGAFSTRYVGGFLLLPLLFYRQWRVATFFCLFMACYLLFNYYQTATFTGGHGFWPTEPLVQRAIRGLSGIAEETALWGIRDWDIKNPDFRHPWAIYGLSAFQFLLVGYILWVILKFKFFLFDNKRHNSKPKFSILSHSCYNWCKNTIIRSQSISISFLVVGICYFLATVCIFMTDESIESLYYRRLAPSSILVVIGLLGILGSQKNKILYQKIKWPIVAFFIISMIHAWPKS